MSNVEPRKTRIKTSLTQHNLWKDATQLGLYGDSIVFLSHLDTFIIDCTVTCPSQDVTQCITHNCRRSLSLNLLEALMILSPFTEWPISTESTDSKFIRRLKSTSGHLFVWWYLDETRKGWSFFNRDSYLLQHENRDPRRSPSQRSFRVVWRWASWRPITSAVSSFACLLFLPCPTGLDTLLSWNVDRRKSEQATRIPDDTYTRLFASENDSHLNIFFLKFHYSPVW